MRQHFIIAAVLLISAMSADAAPFLVGDVPGGGDQCVYRRSGTPVASPIVVDPAIGLPANGNRICKIDLAADPRTGTVTVSVKDSVLQIESAEVSFTFATVSAPSNFRIVP